MRKTSLTLNRIITAALVLVFALSLVAVPALAQQTTPTPTPGNQQQGDQHQGGQQQANQQQNPYDRIEIEISSGGVEGPDALPMGTVILWVTNSDTVPHNVRVQGPGVERQFLSPIQPGATKTLRVEIMQGTYTLETLESGMTLELPVTVQEGGTTTEAQESGQNQGQQATPAQGEEDQSGGQGDSAGSERLVQQGEQIFSSNCALCHGQNGQGQVGPALAGNEFVTGEDSSQVIDVVQHGRGSMPAFDDQLDDEQIAAVISFIRNAWENNASTVSPEQVGGSQSGQQQGGGQDQQTPTPAGEGEQQQGGQTQQTPTPTEEGDQGQQDGQQGEGDQSVPVTGPNQGYSVAPVAQPGQNGQIDVEIALVKVADGFTDPINVVAAPDETGRLFVAERNGIVRVVQQDGTVVEEPFLDISDMTLTAFLEQGLYDLEFHPDFADNGKFYVHFAELLRNGDSMIVEYTVSNDNPDQANPDSARTIMQIDQPWANHNGGELAFGPDGYLYIGSGDGGWEGDPLEAGQDLSTLLGKLLRIDVNTDGSRPYRIPSDNPFASPVGLVQLFDVTEEEFSNIHTEARPEIWAYGLRNPWKFQFDPGTGDLYLPDVGQNHWEEINFQPASSQGGENYGWDILMGSYCFPINEESCDPLGVLPVAEYSHDLGNAVVGIGVYRGEQFGDMDGVYFLADWGSGRIWGLRQADASQAQSNNQQNQGNQGQSGQQQNRQPFGAWTFTELLDSDLKITGSGQDQNGNLYVTSCNCEYGGPAPTENPPGSLWRIVPADQVPEGAETAQGQVPVTGEDDQQDQQSGQDQGQQATPTPTQSGQDQSGGQQGGQDQQATPTPTPTQGGQDQSSNNQGQQGGGEQLVQQGEQVFGNTCAQCHGQNGEGQVGPALAGNEFVTSEDPGPVIDIVQHGRSQMPAFEDQLSEQEIAAVISFIRNAWDNEASTVSPDQVSGDQSEQNQQNQSGQQQATPTPSAGGQGEDQSSQQDEQQDSGQALEIKPGTVRAPLENQMPIGLEVVAEGLTQPIFITTPDDDSGRLFILDQIGQVRIVDEGGNLLDEPFLDVSDRMVELRQEFDERGLLGLAFHPDYAENGRFFVYYSSPLRESAPQDWNHTARISEFSVSEDDPNQADPDSERILLEVDEPQFNHDGGTVMFGPDGYLYISLGDGGAADDVALGHVEDWYDVNEGGNGQDVSQNLLGSILRIDVDSEGDGDRPYGIPEDNPFVGQTGDEAGLPEVYAFGFRNPYRFSFDRGGENQLFVADVGQNAFEEVDIVEKGGNYGWNVKEGRYCFSTEHPDQPLDDCPDTDAMGNPLIDPVIEYVNNNQPDGIGISVTGGYVYRGSQIQDLVGSYVFGDWSGSTEEPRGRLFVSEPQDEGLWPITELVPEGMEFNTYVLGFGEDTDGEMYVATSETTGPTGSTGKIYRLVPAQQNGQQQGQGGQNGQDNQTEAMIPETGIEQGSEQGEQQAGQSEPVDPNRLAMEGGELYGTICSACHMPGGVGTGPFPPLNGNPFVTSEDPQSLADVVLTGRAGMPAFMGDLTEREIAAILTFIRTGWDNNASPVSVEQVEQIHQQIESEREESMPDRSGEGGNNGH